CLSVFLVYYTRSTEFSALSLHDALPISGLVRVIVKIDDVVRRFVAVRVLADQAGQVGLFAARKFRVRREQFIELCNELFASAHRSEEHTSELQSRENLVCRLLLEKKKNK